MVCQTVVQAGVALTLIYAQAFLYQDGSSVHPGNKAEDSISACFVSIQYGNADRAGAPVLGQQGRVEIKAKSGFAQFSAQKSTIGSGDDKIWLQGFDPGEACLTINILRCKHLKTKLRRSQCQGCGFQDLFSAFGTGRLTDHQQNLMLLVRYQLFQSRDTIFRAADEDQLH